ncbi:MAG TPA: GatB/YqeY domain-containing protein [Candidatus Marinimicrobia bacterium]|nr:GatB/YqeY domain-containing protein [Candidatus Neomarinimicrobiota bacterium]
MSLSTQIQKDMYTAMKSGEKEKATTLRGAFSKLKDKRIEKRDDLNEKEEMQVIKTLVKQRNEAIEMYTKANRDDLVSKEQSEREVLETYLPQMMNAEELDALINAVIDETDAASMSDFGKVMPVVMQRSEGRADGKLVQSLVREKLG